MEWKPTLSGREPFNCCHHDGFYVSFAFTIELLRSSLLECISWSYRHAKKCKRASHFCSINRSIFALVRAFALDHKNLRMHSCIDWESCGYDHPSTLGTTVARGNALVWTTLDRERWGSKCLEGRCFRLGSSLPKRATVRVVVFRFRIVVATRYIETVTWDQCIIAVTIMTGKVFVTVAAFTRGENLF